jgi:hypothetical protein
MTGSATDVLDTAPDDFAKVYRRAAGTGSITTISSIAGMGGSVPASERIGRYRW